MNAHPTSATALSPKLMGFGRVGIYAHEHCCCRAFLLGFLLKAVEQHETVFIDK